MSNVRKQTIVISVLIVFIACAALFAKNFNDTVKDSNALSQTVTETNKTMNYFTESRLQKETKFDNSKAQYNEIIKNKELSKKARETASLNLMKMVAADTNESKIETLIKGRGFEDALCMINDNNVEVCVKTAGNMTAQQVHEITTIVINTTKVSPSNIYIKPKQ
jgi:stage III sporulation protein AH